MKGSGSGGARGLGRHRHTALESGATKGKEEGLTTEAQRAQRKDEGVGKRGRSWFGKTQTHRSGERCHQRSGLLRDGCLADLGDAFGEGAVGAFEGLGDCRGLVEEAFGFGAVGFGDGRGVVGEAAAAEDGDEHEA